MSKFAFSSLELYTARLYKGDYAIQGNVLVLYVEVPLWTCLLVNAWHFDVMHGEICFRHKNFNYKYCIDCKWNVNASQAELILWVCGDAGL